MKSVSLTAIEGFLLFCSYHLKVRAGATVSRMGDSEALLLTQSLVVKIPKDISWSLSYSFSLTSPQPVFPCAWCWQLIFWPLHAAHTIRIVVIWRKVRIVIRILRHRPDILRDEMKWEANPSLYSTSPNPTVPSIKSLKHAQNMYQMSIPKKNWLVKKI